jgi:hypothetical protein
MRLLLLSLIPLTLLPAQQEPAAPEGVPAAARQKLADALTKTSQQHGTAFELKWGPTGKQDDNNPFGRILGARMKGKVAGSWHEGLTHVRFDGDEGDELLLAGARMLAKDGTRDWCRRRGHYADGNKLDFVPDPQALLQQLGGWPLAVTKRGAGSFDDRPVEVLSVTLTNEQCADLFYAGALPQALKYGGNMFGNAVQLAIGGGAGRQAPPAPNLTVDLAISLDPGTGRVFEVRGNAWAEKNGNGNVFVFQGGAGQVQVGGAGQEDEEEDEEEAEPEGPLQYKDGLPQRNKKKLSCTAFTLRLTQHGQAAKPQLTEAQQQLLK